jgi:DNA-binding transcriptional LysR family regulator
MNLRKQDLALLMFFDALATHGSVSKAAQQMRVTQPAMSNSLAKLRKMFGDPLFVKTRKGVAPTPKALELMAPVRRALAGIEEILSTTGNFDPATARARLTVTATDYVDFVLMPKLVPYLEKHAPGLDLDIRVANRDMANDWLEQGEIDFRIGWVRRPLAQLHARTLYHDSFVCLVRRDHPSAKSKLTAEAYCALPHVRTAMHRYMELTETGPIIDEAVAALGQRLRIAVRVPDYLAVPFIVASSDLLATVPRRIAAPFLKILPIRMMPPPLELPEIAISLFWHERTQHSALHRWFRAALADIAAAL